MLFKSSSQCLYSNAFLLLHSAKTTQADQSDKSQPSKDEEVETKEQEKQVERVAVRNQQSEVSLHRQISIDVDLQKPQPKKPTIKVASAKQRVRPKQGATSSRKKMSLQEYIRRQTEAQQL